MSKTLNTRIQQKHDFEVNWNQATNFIPYAGEVIIYDPEVDADGNFLTIDGKTASLPSDRTEGYTTSRIKVGDGIHNPMNLEFASSTEGLSTNDDFVFYCGDSEELSTDPYASAEYIVACGNADKFDE